MNQTKVLIIGAGAAGLMAARTLASQGVEFILLESTHRVGGRALTHPGIPPVELGPEYLHGETPLTDSLLEEYGLTYYDLKFNYHLFKNGKLKPVPDFWDRLCEVMKSIKPKQKDISFLEYLRHFDEHSKTDQELTQMFVEGFDAADLDRVSTKALASMKEQVCDPDVRRLRRPLNGYGDLFHKLAESFKDKIKFHHPVEEIKWERGKVEVRGLDAGQKPFQFSAEKVIVTVSVAVLKKLRLVPFPTAMLHYLESVEMGQVMKMVGHLEPEFLHIFPDHAFPFVSTPDLSFSAWWSPTPLHYPLVTAWAGGQRARNLGRMNLEERKKTFINELSLISNNPISKIRTWIKEIHHHNWSDDPSFLGAYSYPVLREKDFRLQTSFLETLYFAGEVFHEEMSGTIEGALVTGQKAGKKILNQI